MNRQEIRDRTRYLCEDELQYAIARDDNVDTEAVREKATMRLVREVSDTETYELVRGLVDSVFRAVERTFIVDLVSGQLGFGKAIRISDNTLRPVERARLRDWIAFDEIREQKFQEHASKRHREREVIAGIIERLQEHGDEATTGEVCPDLFAASDEAAA